MMVRGVTILTVQLNIAGGKPLLSCTVAVTIKLPELVGVPPRVMELPVVEEAENGHVVVHV